MTYPNPLLRSLEKRLMHSWTDLSHLTADEQYKLLAEKVADARSPVVSSDELLERLQRSKATGKPLRVKFGIDPTGPDIHIGHAVPLLNLRLFQRMGHRIQIVIGSFTGMIGDPSGRLDARPALTEEQVRDNMATYEAQASRVFDFTNERVEKHYNADWMNRLGIREWVGILKQISATALLQREDFRTRLSAGQGLSMAELEYAIFMGYDSVVLNPDIELGGMDQFLNMHMCRQMMSNAGQSPEVIIAYNLLAGTTGERDSAGRLAKMSKSKGNYIPIAAAPADMYGKVMSIPDEVMWIWYRELTAISAAELDSLRFSVTDGSIHPKAAKELLARVIVATFNNFDQASVNAAAAEFNSKFGKITVLVPPSTADVNIVPGEMLLDVLARISGKSKGAVRRLVEQQGVRLLRDSNYTPLTIDDLAASAAEFADSVLRIGRREYYRLKS